MTPKQRARIIIPVVIAIGVAVWFGTRSADTDVVKSGDVGVTERVVDHGDTGESPASTLDGIDHGRVVGAVATGLDEHGPRQAESVLKA